jgi:hypothetical protein
MLADRATMPSADEIGAEFERFLAELGDDERPDDGS